MEIQAIHRFSRKKCIFRRTAYTSRRKVFEEKVEKRERGREESREKENSEIALFVIETSLKSLFQHTLQKKSVFWETYATIGKPKKFPLRAQVS